MISDVQLGEELFSQGKFEEAMNCFQTAIESNPLDLEALNDLGVVSMKLGRGENAEQYFLKAIEINDDFLDAHLNLAQYYIEENMWDKASYHLKKTLDANPENIALVKQLAFIHTKMGRHEEARKIVEASKSINLQKEFIDNLWFSIKYWEMVEDLSIRDRLEGLAAGLLASIDGESTPNIHFSLIGQDPESGDNITIEWLRESFYYNESEAYSLVDRRENSREVLTIGDNPDWSYFRLKLHLEMKDEGGCLGDFTHTKKVLKREARLSKYDLERTLEYFMANVGPCDCHVYRAVLV